MKTKIIAEAGVNHNGKLANAYKLIDIAKKAGADYIKFQIFNPEKVATASAKLAKYQLKNNKNEKSQLELIKKLYLSKNEFIKVRKYCLQKKINFLATPFDMESLDFLVKKLKVNLIKISSGDITNYPLIFNVGRFKKKIILSLGMTNFREIDAAIKTYIYGYTIEKEEFNYKKFNKIKIEKYLNVLSKKLVLMHCNTAYPTPVEDANLGNIDLLKNNYPYSQIGFSDHTENIYVSFLSLSKNIEYLEKHFTLNKKLKGPDHSASLSPAQLNKLIELRNKYSISLKKKKNDLTNSERSNYNIVRRGIYAAKDINKGDEFTRDNLILKRPINNKFKNIDYWKLIGKKSKKNYYKDENIAEIF